MPASSRAAFRILHACRLARLEGTERVGQRLSQGPWYDAALIIDPMIHFVITDHAFERARERAGWKRPTLARMLERIFFDGVAASTPCRKIREFLRHYQEREPGRYARAYGEHVFLFARGHADDEAVLVTVLPLPHEFRVAARDARRRGWDQ